MISQSTCNLTEESLHSSSTSTAPSRRSVETWLQGVTARRAKRKRIDTDISQGSEDEEPESKQARVGARKEKSNIKSMAGQEMPGISGVGLYNVEFSL